MKFGNILSLLGGLAVLATANPVHAMSVTFGPSLVPVVATFDSILVPTPNGTTSLSSYSEGGITFTQATYANGNVSGKYAAPTGDLTNYLTVAPVPQTSPVTLTFDTPTNTLGFLWGSIDRYNTITFNYLGGGSTTFTGGDIGALGGFVANGTLTRYVTFAEPLKVFSNVQLSSTNFAMETDNYSAGTTTPEPSTFLQLGIGAAAILFGRRRFGK